MIRKIIQVTSFAFILLINNIEANAYNIKQELTTAINNYKSNHNLNAIYAVTKDNKTLLKGANGFSDIEHHKKLSADAAMPIASGTKQMTAACILKLQERGKLNVQDTIAKYLSEDSYYFEGKLPKWANKITLHQLLTHTSGLAEYIPNLKINTTQPHVDINKQIVQYAVNQPLSFEAGSKYQYCNTGYVILGLIIEQVSGKDLISFFKDELFTPLNMKNTELATLKKALDFQYGKLKNFPNRYFAIPTNDKPNFMPVNTDLILIPFADGGVLSTLDDLNIWNYALHNGKVLSPESYKLMTTPYVETDAQGGFNTHMGYGIYIAKSDSGNVFYMHGGRAVGIRGEYVYIPEKNMAISIISNVYVYEPQELQGKIDYSLPANQIDITYFMQALLKTVNK